MRVMATRMRGPEGQAEFRRRQSSGARGQAGGEAALLQLVAHVLEKSLVRDGTGTRFDSAEHLGGRVLDIRRLRSEAAVSMATRGDLTVRKPPLAPAQATFRSGKAPSALQKIRVRRNLRMRDAENSGIKLPPRCRGPAPRRRRSLHLLREGALPAPSPWRRGLEGGLFSGLCQILPLGNAL